MEGDPVTTLENVIEACKGQARTLEAVIASVIVFLAFSTASYLIYASENILAQETVDLNRLSYNVLHRIVESGVIEETVEEDPQNGIDHLKMVVQELLPAGVYFDLTVYNCTGNPTQPYSGSLNISNAPAEVFAESEEVTSTSIIYTSRRGNIYYLILKLTRV
jgi:hypothetical protein